MSSLEVKLTVKFLIIEDDFRLIFKWFVIADNF